MQCFLPLVILNFRLKNKRTSQLSSTMHCRMELYEGDNDSVLLLRSPSLIR